MNAPTSTSFWSITCLDRQTAVTLHLFLDPEDQLALNQIKNVNTVSELLVAMGESSVLSRSCAYRQLQAIFRPKLAGYGRKVASTRPGQWTFIHNGAGLTGTRTITVGGQPVADFQALSDGVLRVTVPQGATGELKVTTEMGESDPAPVVPAFID